MTLRIYAPTETLNHDTGDTHPENLRRAHMLLDLFKADYASCLRQDDIAPLSLKALERIHQSAYLQNIKSISEGISEQSSQLHCVDSDTVLSAQSWQAITSSAASSRHACSALLSREITSAFCLTRPPGHHAEYKRANGFCFFNYAFDAALEALAQKAIKRIAILDYDVHHGNGTEDLVRRFYSEGTAQNDGAEIHYFSSFEHGIFPGLDYDPKQNKGCAQSDHAIHLYPFGSGHQSIDMRHLYEEHIFPDILRFEPEFIILSSGFDAHRDDPLSSACWDEEDYAFITHSMKNMNTPILSVLEGGYNLEALENCVCAHLDEFI